MTTPTATVLRRSLATPLPLAALALLLAALLTRTSQHPPVVVPPGTGPTQRGAALMQGRQTRESFYVCPMHPQVVRPQPGKCPLCGMDLVSAPHGDAGGGVHEREAHAVPGTVIAVSSAIVDQLGVRTARVERADLARQVEGFGVFLRTALQGYRSVNQGPVPTPEVPLEKDSAVMLQGQVFERDAALLHAGQKVRVQVPNLESQVWEGQVIGFEAQVNQSTRTQVFHVAVANAAAGVPPGMTAVLTVDLDPVRSVLLVPRDAVIVTGRGSRVVVALGGGRFAPREVIADDLGEDRIIIRSGLAEGEEVVVSAQFLLDSEANLQAGLERLDSAHEGQAQPAGGGQ